MERLKQADKQSETDDFYPSLRSGLIPVRPPRVRCCTNDPPQYKPRPRSSSRESGRLSLKPRIYLAGKIRKNCWRHELVPGLRTAGWEGGPLVCSDFVYVGPFFVGCDHGCYHGPTTHGCGLDLWTPDVAESHDVAKACRQAVRNSNLVFCYIESPDCYGTLVEIGWAQEADIPVVIAFAPGVARPTQNEFHLACSYAYASAFDVTKNDLPGLFERAIREFSW